MTLNRKHLNTTRNQIVIPTYEKRGQVTYQVIQPTSDNKIDTFVCSLDRFERLYLPLN
jgi:hypothetical protein